MLIGDSGVGKSCLLLRFAVSSLIVFERIFKNKYCPFVHLSKPANSSNTHECIMVRSRKYCVYSILSFWFIYKIGIVRVADFDVFFLVGSLFSFGGIYSVAIRKFFMPFVLLGPIVSPKKYLRMESLFTSLIFLSFYAGRFVS